jgi:hypothetical protein
MARPVTRTAVGTVTTLVLGAGALGLLAAAVTVQSLVRVPRVGELWVENQPGGDHVLRIFLIATAGIAAVNALTALPFGSAVGFWLGLYWAADHLIGWTFSDPGRFNQPLQFVTLFALLVATHPWRVPARLLRSGAFWIGPAVLAPGVLIAVLRGDVGNATFRTFDLALVVLGLAVLLGHPRRHLTGMTAGATLVLCVALLAGFVSPVTIEGRLAGGTLALTHPNLLALFAAFLATAWTFLGVGALRLAAAVPFVGLIVLADSRTALGMCLLGLLFGVGRGKGIVLLAPVLGAAVLAVGGSFFLQARYGGGDALSGRQLIWNQGLDDWRAADALGRLLGPSSGNFPTVELDDGRVFVTHNSLLEALLRGGVVGLACLAVGLLLLIYHLIRLVSGRTPFSPWVGGALIGASLVTVWTEAWLVAGPVWWWVAAGEALLLDHASRPASLTPAPARPVLDWEAGSALPPRAITTGP